MECGTCRIFVSEVEGLNLRAAIGALHALNARMSLTVPPPIPADSSFVVELRR